MSDTLTTATGLLYAYLTGNGVPIYTQAAPGPIARYLKDVVMVRVSPFEINSGEL